MNTEYTQTEIQFNRIVFLLFFVPILCYIFWPTKSIRPERNLIQESCVDQAMLSDSKRQTAKLAVAVHMERTDQAHLIRHIDTREAVKAVYCSNK